MPGVERLMLDRIGGEVARATSIVRYGPGSRFSAHVHGGGEEFLVLEGNFSDDSGDYGAGCYVRNPVGSHHAPWSEAGAILFVKLCQMDPADRAFLSIDTTAAAWLDGPAPEIGVLPLHRHGGEFVRLLAFDPGAALTERACPGGAELLVLEGAVETPLAPLRERDWLRLPPGAALALSSVHGGRIYLKTGHLAAP